MPTKFDFISPGVLLREIDQSVLPPALEEDGPIIIGRTRKGPGMKPVKVKSMDDFIAVFGRPVPGGTTNLGDVWRDGNTVGPTYAAYAAQSWLASGVSPVTMVRLLGDQQPGTSTAGWQPTANAVNSAVGSNGGAYGLFIVDKGGAVYNPTGSLAAIWYLDSGAILLSGTVADGTSHVTASAATFIKSADSANQFTVSIQNSSGVEVQKTTFNFTRNNENYIRNVFNTNPQLTNGDIHAAANVKTYWLGETFERHLGANVTGSTAGEQYGIILGLQSGTDNWSQNKTNFQAAASGWVFDQNTEATASYQPQNQQKLFRCIALSEGEEPQRDLAIAIQDLKLPTNPSVNNYSTFTLRVLDFITGQLLEEYTGLNLNPSSPNYVGVRIGDMTQEWSEADRRYRMVGDYDNQSDYIRVELGEDVAENGPNNKQALPFGFYGPVRPKGFTLMSGSTAAKTLGAHTAFANAMAKAGTDIPYGSVNGNFITGTVALYTASFEFPKLPLRAGGSDGYSTSPYKVYYGIRPTIDTNSTLKDPDYIDYLRRWNAPNYSETASGNNEYSFIFSLDDIVINVSTNTVTYTSGSQAAGTARSATSGLENSSNNGLLDLGVKQFVMPLVGGFDGLDITEAEPFRNTALNGAAESTSSPLYSINKAIDSVADAEVAPANLMLVPGVYDSAVTNRLINTCERRKDALAIIDLQSDYVPTTEGTDSASTRRGNVDDAVRNLKNRNLNTSYACAFYPAVQISDNLSAGERVWVPASIAGLGAMAQSEARSELWFAPAGFNRGGLGNLGGLSGPRVTQARQRLDSGERDNLYEVNINPIATFPNEGVVIFGQKTLQVTPSALDRINVRRLLLYLKSKVNHISRNLLFDQNVSSTWARFTSQVEPILSDVQARFGITEYKLILDETTTTPDLIDRNIMYAKIFLKPARAIEYIVVDFIITRTGADFA